MKTPHFTKNTGRVIHAGIQEYHEALKLMQSIVAMKHEREYPELLLLLEHTPVITLGKSATTDELHLPTQYLTAKGISVHHVERGGLATYHGPGQLVGYLMIDLRKNNLSPSDLVFAIETAIINTLSSHAIDARQVAGRRGVWVEEKKIASIGIAVKRGISYHGFALNCSPDLNHFDLINPCGFKPGIMTSMSRLLGRPISTEEVKLSISKELEESIGITFSASDLRTLEADVTTVAIA